MRAASPLFLVLGVSPLTPNASGVMLSPGKYVLRRADAAGWADTVSVVVR